MQEQHSSQSSCLAMIHDELIPCAHLLRPLSPAVDLSPVPDLFSDWHCQDNGPLSRDPLMSFRAVSLQFLYDHSDRHLEEHVNLHLACKWFVGMQPSQTAPDHTALCRFYTRLETNDHPSSSMVKKNRGGLEGLWLDPPGGGLCPDADGR
jgi:transposase